MELLLPNLKIKVSDGLFQIDPFTSKLGKKIIFHSVEMITELGFEKFTFKKLGEYIGSPEASIYRYFKSKNQLLCYLISWFWGWMECRLILEIANISSPIVRLEKSIALVLSNTDEHLVIEEVEIYKLHQITISESIKTYIKKDVDTSNKEGAFSNYKQFVERVSKIINEINPDYKYPQMLLTTIFEGAHLQVFFGEHLPRLTNKQNTPDYITKFYINLAMQSINSSL
jgi:AcrR family transcriptional regulator